jgi:hypothetical protein
MKRKRLGKRKQIANKLKKRKELFLAILFGLMLLLGMMFTFQLGYLRGFYETTIAKQIEMCVNVCNIVNKMRICV